MRLNRRRRRSLHDLDVGSARYDSFLSNVPNVTDHAGDWINAILTDRERNERIVMRRNRERTLNHAAHDAMRNDAPPPRRVVSGMWRDVLQLNERIPERDITRLPREQALEAVAADLRLRIRRHIDNQYPGTAGEWQYRVDYDGPDPNRDINITITARRH